MENNKDNELLRLERMVRKGVTFPEIKRRLGDIAKDRGTYDSSLKEFADNFSQIKAGYTCASKYGGEDSSGKVFMSL